MAQPQWTPGTPLPVTPAPVGWTISQAGADLNVIGTPSGAGPIGIGTLINSTGVFQRSALTPAQASALGVQVDADNKIVTN